MESLGQCAPKLLLLRHRLLRIAGSKAQVRIPASFRPAPKTSRPVLFRCLRDARSLGIMEAGIGGLELQEKGVECNCIDRSE